MNPYYVPNTVLVLRKMPAGASHLCSKVLPGCRPRVIFCCTNLGFSATEQVDYLHYHDPHLQAPATFT